MKQCQTTQSLVDLMRQKRASLCISVGYLGQYHFCISHKTVPDKSIFEYLMKQCQTALVRRSHETGKNIFVQPLENHEHYNLYRSHKTVPYKSIFVSLMKQCQTAHSLEDLMRQARTSRTLSFAYIS